MTQKIQEESPFIQQAIAGDAAAPGQLYEQYRNRIFRYFWHKTGNVTLAEDLLHDAFLRIIQNISRFKHDLPVAAWINAISHNLLVDHYRLKVVSSIEDVEMVADLKSDPVSLVAERLDNIKLYQAIAKLKPYQQQLVKARFIDGMGYEQLAQQMGKSEGAMRVMLHRALLTLRTLLPENPS